MMEWTIWKKKEELFGRSDRWLQEKVKYCFVGDSIVRKTVSRLNKEVDGVVCLPWQE